MPIEEQILQAVYDTSLDAIIVIDQKGLMRSYNKIAEKLFHYSAKEVLGQNIKMLMPPYFAEQHDGYLERYLRTGERRIIGIGRVVTGQRKDGSTFPAGAFDRRGENWRRAAFCGIYQGPHGPPADGAAGA